MFCFLENDWKNLLSDNSSKEYTCEEILSVVAFDLVVSEIVEADTSDSSNTNIEPVQTTFALCQTTLVMRADVCRERQEAVRVEKEVIICSDCSRSFASKNQLIQYYGEIFSKCKVKEKLRKTQDYDYKNCNLSFVLSHNFESHNNSRRHRTTSST